MLEGREGGGEGVHGCLEGVWTCSTIVMTRVRASMKCPRLRSFQKSSVCEYGAYGEYGQLMRGHDL